MFSRALTTFTLIGAIGACSSSTDSSSGASEDAGGSTDAGNAAESNDSGGNQNAGSDAGSSSSNATDAGGGGKGAFDAGAPTSDSATITINIPSSVTGAPTNLAVALVPSIPVATIPTSIYSVKNPTVTPGQPITVTGNYLGISGTYYVLVVLYMPGGGEGVIPVNGTDYEGASSTSFTFSNGPVNLGTVTLKLAEADAGL